MNLTRYLFLNQNMSVLGLPFALGHKAGPFMIFVQNNILFQERPVIGTNDDKTL